VRFFIKPTAGKVAFDEKPHLVSEPKKKSNNDLKQL
jgi:hypothetical protein